MHWLKSIEIYRFFHEIATLIFHDLFFLFEWRFLHSFTECSLINSPKLTSKNKGVSSLVQHLQSDSSLMAMLELQPSETTHHSAAISW
jgi:hypothetical protein